MNRKRYILLLILGTYLPLCLFAGAWNKKKGHGYAQLSYTFLYYNRLLQGAEKPIGLKRTIYDHTIQYYEEYGLSDRFNLIVNVPFKLTSSSSSLNSVENDPYVNDTLDPGSLNGFSNLSFGTRIKLYEGKYVLGFQFMAQNNMHQYQAYSGLRVGYDAWLFAPTLLFGKGWDGKYFQTEWGVLLNNGQYSNNLIGNIEYGKKFGNNKNYFMFRLDVKMPISTGTYNEGNSVQTGLFRDNSSYISPGIKYSRILGEHWYFNFGIYGAFFSENEGGNATYNFGLAYEW